jgi:hypothetical protein
MAFGRRSARCMDKFCICASRVTAAKAFLLQLANGGEGDRAVVHHLLYCKAGAPDPGTRPQRVCSSSSARSC